MIKDEALNIERDENYSNYNIAVIGDVMLDVTYTGRPAPDLGALNKDCSKSARGIDRAAEHGEPILLNPEKTYALGGAANVAANIAALGARCTLVSAVNSLREGEVFSDLLDEAGIKRLCVQTDSPLTTKTRFVDQALEQAPTSEGLHLMRMDAEDTDPMPDLDANRLYGFLLGSDDIDAYIISDYNKGVMTPHFIRLIMDLGKARGIPVFVDPKFDNFWEYGSATIFKCNKVEAGRVFPPAVNPLYIKRKLDVAHVVVTLGGEGMGISVRDESTKMCKHIPAHPVDVVDVTGAGDVVMAVLSLEYLRTNDIMKAAELANKAGALAVSRPGTAVVSYEELFTAKPAPDSARGTDVASFGTSSEIRETLYKSNVKPKETPA